MMAYRLAVLVAALLALFAAPTQAQTRGQVLLYDDPTVEGDRISVPVYFEGVNPLSLVGLSAVSFSVDEPAADLSLEREARLGHSLVILVPVGFGSDVDLIQATLRAYTSAYVQPDDRVLMLTLDGRGLTRTETSTPAELADAINALRASSGYPLLAQAIPDALEWLEAAPNDHVPLAMVVASYLNSGEDRTTSAAFAGAGYPLHVVQAHTFRQTSTTPMQQMAANTGGLFIDNLRGIFSQGAPPTASASLKVLYDALAATRDVFTVSYRAISTALDTEPQVTLTVQLSLTQAAEVSFTYERAFQPPIAAFSQQTIAPIRRPSSGPTGLVFDNETQPVNVRVTFPDNVPRRVVSLQLEVIDANTGTVLQSATGVNPQQDTSGAYRIDWPLVDFIEPGRSYPVRLRVTATDELGLTASAEQQAAVTVAALPPTATPTPTATFTPSPTPRATATPTLDATEAESGVVSPPLTTGQSTPSSPTTPTVAPSGAPDPLVWVLGAVAGVLALIALVLFVALIRARNRPTQTATQSDAATVGLSLMDMPTPLPDAPAVDPLNMEQGKNTIYGRLLVKRGLPAGEVLLVREEFTVGRKADADVHYQIDKPYVSPRHCVITHKRGRFTIRDLNSKNGTFVNGERLQPDRDVIVPIGSEVAITQNVVFELWDKDTIVKVDYQGEAVRSTRITQESGVKTNTGTRTGSTVGGDFDGDPIDDDYSPV